MLQFVRRLSVSVALAATAMLFAPACAEQRPDRNYVQPNVVPKSIFEGEWYTRSTVVDVPYHVNETFISAQSELDRVRWEIQEDFLIAYRTYEQINNTDNAADDPNFKGGVVAMFAIESHFDVQRGYNPLTGEQNNTINENTTDRAWYEREFMRVDWSENRAAPNVYNIAVTGYGTFADQFTPESYFVQSTELDNPYQPVVGPDYIDIVSKDALVDTSGLEGFDCYFLTGMRNFNCGTGVVTRRNSFVKIQGDSDYRPLSYPDNFRMTYKAEGANGEAVEKPIRLRYSAIEQDEVPCAETDDPEVCNDVYMGVFEKFGFFRTERLSYDNERGLTEGGVEYIGHRWNIWKDSYDDAGNPIPYENREVKPIIYYLNADYPEDLKEVALQMGKDWNEPFADTYRFLTRGKEPPVQIFEVRENDCNLKNVAAYLASHEELKSTVQQYIGTTDITADDLIRTCAVLTNATRGLDDQFTWQQFGDIRYSFMNVLSKPTQAPWFGYGPSSVNPRTGEIVVAEANVDGASLDRYAAYATDIVMAINQDLPVGDITTGDNVRRQIEQSLSQKARMMSMLHMPEAANNVTKQIDARFAALPEASALNADRLKPAADFSARLKADTSERYAAIEGTAAEKLLLNDEVVAAFGGNGDWRPGMPVTDEMREAALPGQWAGMKLREFRDKRMETLMNHRNGCMYLHEFTDPSVIGLALELREKNASREEIYQLVRREVFRGVMLHEIGHTLGLNHNFEGSFDSLNYFDKYWEIRIDSEAAIEELRGQLTADGLKPGTPEYVNAFANGYERIYLDAAKRKQSQYQYSTIMDYHAKFNSDFEGLGRYDKAAIKFGYGGIVEMWDPHEVDIGSLSETSPDVYGFWYTNEDFVNSLRSVRAVKQPGKPTTFEERANMLNKRIDVSFDRYVEEIRKSYVLKLKQDGVKLAKEEEEAIAEFESQINEARDRELEESVEDLEKRDVDDLDFLRYCGNTNTCLNRIVRYRFNNDYFANSISSNNRFDEGSSFTEIAANALAMYNNYYIFNNFQRDRIGFAMFGGDGLMGTLYDRYFQFMVRPFLQAYIYRFYVFGGFYGEDALNRPDLYGPEQEGSLRSQISFYQDLSTAGCLGLNALAGVIATPEPGYFCYSKADNSYRRVSQDYVVEGEPYQEKYKNISMIRSREFRGCESPYTEVNATVVENPEYDDLPQDIYIPVGVGKYHSSDFTSNYLYSWKRIGSFYDKLAALEAITGTQNQFYRIDEYANLGTYTINYWRVFRKELIDMVSGILLREPSRYAGRWTDKGFEPPTLCNFNVNDPSALETQNTDNSAAPVVDPVITETLLNYVIFMGMANMTSSVDETLDFSRYIKVSVKGAVDDIDYAPGSDIIEWQEPNSGYVYRAAQTLDAKSIAYELIAKAKAFQEGEWSERKAARDYVVALSEARAAYLAANPTATVYPPTSELTGLPEAPEGVDPVCVNLTRGEGEADADYFARQVAQENACVDSYAHVFEVMQYNLNTEYIERLDTIRTFQQAYDYLRSPLIGAQ